MPMPPAGGPLAIDWIPADAFADGLPGRIGLTVLPGKHGASERYPGLVYDRDLDADLEALTDAGVRRLLLLVTDAELRRWGDPAIVERAAERGIEVARRPIPDGEPPSSRTAALELVDWLREARALGNVAIACMGGVGRSGTVAACALVAAGWEPSAAIDELRRVRHPTTVETAVQEEFVRRFAAGRSG